MKNEFSFIILLCFSFGVDSGPAKLPSSSTTLASLGSTVATNVSTTQVSTVNEEDDSRISIRNISQCFKDETPFSCFRDRVMIFIKDWREDLLSRRIENSISESDNSDSQISTFAFEDLFKDVGRVIYRGFSHLFFGKKDGNGARADFLRDIEDVSNDLERGHKKKKKAAEKAVKKFILKIILAIFLKLLKIKMILAMIQSIVTTKLIAAAILYVLTITFKIWWEIKNHKKHAEKNIVYYEPPHHEHTYHDYPPESHSSEHIDIDHSGEKESGSWSPGLSLWGRSYTSPPNQGIARPTLSPLPNHQPYRLPPFPKPPSNMLFNHLKVDDDDYLKRK